MAKRNLIRIDESKCDGCGLCVPACEEGAIQIVDGKARLVSDVYCDGLGACLGHCPRGAITIEEVEARPFDEEAVRRHLEASRPSEAPRASAAAAPLAIEGFKAVAPATSGCPGSRSTSFESEGRSAAPGPGGGSALGHWPVQMHLISPHAPQYRDADVLLCADCVPFALAGFHDEVLPGRALAIACPKLDPGQDSYVDKLVALIDDARIRSLTVMVMEVPCCNGLVALARAATERAQRPVSVGYEVVSVRGERLASGAA
jgi:ferredoxin